MIWSGLTSTRPPVRRPSRAWLASGVRRSVAASLPARIARESTAPGSWSGLLAPPGTLTSVASWPARLLRNVRLSGSTHASERVTVEPTLAPAAASVATVSLTTPPSAPGATTTATFLPVSVPATTWAHLLGPSVAGADAPLGCGEVGPQAGLVLPQLGQLVGQGVAQVLLERTGTEHDPDREGQEDRDDGDEVVAEVDHVKIPTTRDHTSSHRAPTSASMAVPPGVAARATNRAKRPTISMTRQGQVGDA